MEKSNKFSNFYLKSNKNKPSYSQKNSISQDLKQFLLKPIKETPTYNTPKLDPDPSQSTTPSIYPNPATPNHPFISSIASSLANNKEFQENFLKQNKNTTALSLDQSLELPSQEHLYSSLVGKLDSSLISPKKKTLHSGSTTFKLTLGKLVSLFPPELQNQKLHFSPLVRKHLKIVGHPLRLQILHLLKSNPSNLQNLVVATEQDKFHVFNQLNVLLNQKIIQKVPKEQNAPYNSPVYYTLTETNYLHFAQLFSNQAKYSEIAEILKLISHPLALFVLKLCEKKPVNFETIVKQVNKEFDFLSSKKKKFSEKARKTRVQPFSYCFVNKTVKFLTIANILGNASLVNSSNKNYFLVNKEVAIVLQTLEELYLQPKPKTRLS